MDIVYRFDPTATAPTPPADGAEAVDRLTTGNREFARMFDAEHAQAEPKIVNVHPGQFGFSGDAGQPAPQEPFAIVLGCADARVPIELIFNQVQNELFVIRVAGNVLGDECLGSIQYALAHLHESIQLIVVLGHRACGAVTAAVDSLLDPAAYPKVASSQSLRSIVDRIFISVNTAATELRSAWGDDVLKRPGYRQAVIETSVTMNAALTAWTLRSEVRSALRPGMSVVYGVYDLMSRLVRVPLAAPGAANATDFGLHPPPADADAFRALSRAVAGSEYTRELLDTSS